MRTFAFTNAGRYGLDYGRLGEVLGVAGATPAPGEVEFLQTVTEPDRFTFGMLAAPEVFFAAAATSILRPQFAIEIGTASGSSAAVIAKMIALRESEAGPTKSGPLVFTRSTTKRSMLSTPSSRWGLRSTS